MCFLLFSIIIFFYAIGINSENLAEPRIVGGSEIPIEIAPYQVSIRFLGNDQNYGFGRGHTCGGILISNSTVLTAAHCLVDGNRVRSGKEFQIVAGATLLSNRTGAFITIGTRVVKHEKYNSRTLQNDIGIIKLANEIPLNTTGNRIRAIELPTQSYPVNANCMISGWGNKVQGVSEFINHLRAANVTINSLSTCNSLEAYNGHVVDGMFCAGPLIGGTDSCQGDSGGPLACNNIIYGIVSHGDGCGSRNKPGVYTDVFYYKQWILLNGSVPLYFSKSILSLCIIFGLIIKQFLK